MSYDHRRSTPVINGTHPASGSIPYGRLSEFQSGVPTPVAPTDPQNVIRELQQTRQQLQQVTREKQRLEALAQQLQQEITAAMESVEGVQSALTRTQRQLHQLCQLAAGEISGSSILNSSVPETPQTIQQSKGQGTHPGMQNQGSSPSDPNYDFLARLKRRRSEDTVSSNGPRSYAPPSESNGVHRDPTGAGWQAVPPPFPAPPPRSVYGTSGGAKTSRRGLAEEAHYPERPHRRKGSVGSRRGGQTSTHSTPYGTRDNPLPPYGTLSDADLLDHLGLDPQDPAYVDTLTQQARKQQSPSLLLWLTVALLLVVGSFGAGFLVVQPFIQDADPPAQPFPSN